MVKKCALSIAMALLLGSTVLADSEQLQDQIILTQQMVSGPGFVGAQANYYMGTIINGQLVGNCYGSFPLHHYFGNWFGFSPWLPIGWHCMPSPGSGCHLLPIHCGIGSVTQFQCQVINSCGGSVVATQNQTCTIGP